MTRWVTRWFEIERDDHSARKSLRISVEVPNEYRPRVDALLQRSYGKHAGHLMFTVDVPRLPRSTGPRSINNRIHGHCEDLAEQIPAAPSGELFTADEIYEAMKRMAVTDGGYPTYLSLDGKEEPLPMRRCSQDEALIVVRVIQRFADMHDYYLTEYDDTSTPPVPYQSKGGRTRAEMAALEARK